MVCEAGGDPQPSISWIKVSRFCSSLDAGIRYVSPVTAALPQQIAFTRVVGMRYK